jgi:hypothetical protein
MREANLFGAELQAFTSQPSNRGLVYRPARKANPAWQTGGGFVKRHVRRKDGKAHAYYPLCEGVRLSATRVIQPAGERRQCRLFTDREGAAPPDAAAVCEVLLSSLSVRHPRQFGAGWARQPAGAGARLRRLLCRSLTGSTRPGGRVQSDRTCWPSTGWVTRRANSACTNAGLAPRPWTPSWAPTGRWRPRTGFRGRSTKRSTLRRPGRPTGLNGGATCSALGVSCCFMT